MGHVTWTDIGLIILAIILPPLAVFLKSEEFGKDFVLNCLLSIFGWLPGQIHAIFYIVTTNLVYFDRYNRLQVSQGKGK